MQNKLTFSFILGEQKFSFSNIVIPKQSIFIRRVSISLHGKNKLTFNESFILIGRTKSFSNIAIPEAQFISQFCHLTRYKFSGTLTLETRGAVFQWH